MRGFIKVMGVLVSLFFGNSSLYAGSAPDFELDGVNEKIKLADYHGSVVYIDFWASWCGPCRKSFPWMNEIKERYSAKGLKIIAINLDANKLDASQFIHEMKPNFDIAFDPSGDVAGRYQVAGMPSAYLIDRNGELHSAHIGFRSKDIPMLEQEISLLLSTSKVEN